MELAMLIISSASFMTGSAKGLYGSGSGDSSAAVGKLLVQSQKINTEVKNLKNNTYTPFALSCFFGSPSFFPGFMGVFFIFIYNSFANSRPPFNLISE
jgi:hypothetical protein